MGISQGAYVDFMIPGGASYADNGECYVDTIAMSTELLRRVIVDIDGMAYHLGPWYRDVEDLRAAVEAGEEEPFRGLSYALLMSRIESAEKDYLASF